MPIIRGPLRGYKWIVGSGLTSMWIGTYEWLIQEMFVQLTRPGWHVLDIGAHVGFFSLLASRLVGQSGSVIAFEPNPRNIRFLKRHLELNNRKNTVVFETAVSNYSGVANFECTNSHVAGHIVQTQSGGISVPVVKVDELYSEGKLPRPNLIKIDVEGEELLVLNGMLHLLSSARPMILLSTHRSKKICDECTNLLTGIGYAVEFLQKPVEGSHLREIVATPRESSID